MGLVGKVKKNEWADVEYVAAWKRLICVYWNDHWKYMKNYYHISSNVHFSLKERLPHINTCFLALFSK